MVEKEDLLTALSGEIDPSFIGSQEFRSPKGKFVKRLQVRVANLGPQASRKEIIDFQPGMRVRDGNTDPATLSMVPEVRAVVLFAVDGRVARGVKGIPSCQSFDGIRPAPRIETPKCQKADATTVAAVLSQWKGYDQAKITETVSSLTEGSACLQFCSIKSRTGFIPICPAARKDDQGRPATCKAIVTLYAYDLTTQQEFEMELAGSSIRDYPTLSPYLSFRKFVSEKKHPTFGYEVTLYPEEDGNYYRLGVKDFTPITDKELLLKMKTLAYAAKESHEKRASWVPSERRDIVEVPKAAPLPSKPILDAEVNFDDDEIPF